MRICVILNPAARGEKARRARQQLQSLGQDVVLRPTSAAGGGRWLASEAVREGFETIVAVGGDGTINEVLNGISDAPDGLRQCRLGVLPMGTANVFAMELGMPADFQEGWRIIQAGRSRSIDLLTMAFHREGGTDRRALVQLAGAGFDARATELVSWALKKKNGHLAYVDACRRALKETHPPILASGDASSASGMLVLIGNGRYYGGKFPLFPAASQSDGRMDVCVFPTVNYGVVWACAWAAATNTWRRLRCVRRFQTARLRLEAPRRVPVEIDGEPVGVLPACCEVLPGALNVVVP